ncbi:MAG TPA: GNAT family N-acetyltransferase [Rubrobacter sp.]|nr:GNAT family N-acetyltransferase [Rubrobacter sp.]
MGDPFGLEMAKIRQAELLREAEGRRIARALKRFRGGDVARLGSVGTEGIGVRWGLAGDELAVAELLELNGMPRWISFEERFVVAEEDGRVLGAVRYRTESKRLILGLLVVDPWAGEERLARALYRGAGELAREMGVREVLASASPARYPGMVGYRRRGRSWRLDVTRLPSVGGGSSSIHGVSRG